MTYYRDAVTDQSWRQLQKLSQSNTFTLIGGWAVWLYTSALKSKDIDIIIDLEMLGALRQIYDVQKNDRLHKYEIIDGPVNIDIYVPHWSKLGLPIDTITKNQQIIQGFQVPQPEILVLLKQVAYTARSGSAKGKKDLIDIIALALLPALSWKNYALFARDVTLPMTPLAKIISPIVDVPELSLNRHAFSRLKKQWLMKLE